VVVAVVLIRVKPEFNTTKRANNGSVTRLRMVSALHKWTVVAAGMGKPSGHHVGVMPGRGSRSLRPGFPLGPRY
jgi:hypothetical protein